jgi:hypothetical protein
LWSFALIVFGVTWVMHRLVIELLFFWRGVYGVPKKVECWNLLPEVEGEVMRFNHVMLSELCI